MKQITVLLVLLMGVVGCNTLSDYGTMNVQRSGLRGAGDLSVTVMLDQTQAADVEQLKAEITTFLYAVRGFAETGNIATLTRTELITRLLGEVAGQYTPWVHMAINAALTTLDPTVSIGEAGRKRLIAFVYGSLTATACYQTEDRAEERGLSIQESLETGLPVWPETVVGNALVKTERRP